MGENPVPRFENREGGVADRDDVEEALRFLSWSDAVLTAAAKARDQKLAAIQEQHETATAELREIASTTNIELVTWANENRSKLIDGKSKTAKLNWGEISWRSSPAKLGYLPEWDKTKTANAVDESTGIVAKLVRQVKKLTGFTFLKVSISVDLKAAKQALDDKAISWQRLRGFGLQRIAASEKVTAKPAKFIREDTAAAA